MTYFKPTFLLLIIQILAVKLGQATDDEKPIKSSSPITGNLHFTGLTHENGTCCHVNEVIQLLYFIPEFRHAVYKWKPRAQRTKRSKLTGSIIEVIDCPQNVALVLQSIFARMQNSASTLGGLPVRTIQLVKALKKTEAWITTTTTTPADESEDVMDPFWILSKLLKILDPLLNGKIDQLFTGIKRLDQISIKMDVTPGDPEAFKNIKIDSDPNLNGNDLLDYLKRETSWQPQKEFSTKTTFLSLPPILIFSPQQAIKAARDPISRRTRGVGVVGNLNFPRDLDMTPFLEGGKTKPFEKIVYRLKAVVVTHQNGKKLNGFIDIDVQPDADDPGQLWYRFDDVRVTPMGDKREGDNFVESAGGPSEKKESGEEDSHLMLVYRKIGVNGPLVVDVDVPSNLPRRAKDFGVTGCRKLEPNDGKRNDDGKSEL